MLRTIGRATSRSRVYCSARREPGRRGPAAPPVQRVAPARRRAPPPPARWAFSDWTLYARGWTVPWGGGTLLLGAVGCTAVFTSSGLLALWLVSASLGAPLHDLPRGAQTGAVLGSQALETLFGLGFLWLTVRPFAPLPDGWFVVDLSQPLAPANGWLVWACLGYVAAFGAIAAAASAQQLAGPVGPGAGTVDAILPLLAPDFGSLVALVAVTALLAPVLEEALFRGFLLPTLTKWLPAPAAVLLTALLFAGVHFAPRDFPQLVALGTVLGFAQVRTRNLAVPIAIHGAWNGGVLASLALVDTHATGGS